MKMWCESGAQTSAERDLGSERNWARKDEWNFQGRKSVNALPTRTRTEIGTCAAVTIGWGTYAGFYVDLEPENMSLVTSSSIPVIPDIYFRFNTKKKSGTEKVSFFKEIIQGVIMRSRKKKYSLRHLQSGSKWIRFLPTLSMSPARTGVSWYSFMRYLKHIKYVHIRIFTVWWLCWLRQC